MSEEESIFDEDELDVEIERVSAIIRESLIEIVDSHREEAQEMPITVLFTMSVLSVYESAIAEVADDDEKAAMRMVAVAHATEDLRADALECIAEMLNE